MKSSLVDTTDLAFVYVTFPATEEADKTARAAIESRLAACANIFSEHRSIYRWKGAVESAAECAVIFKTTKAQCEPLAALIRSHHSFDVPCIAVLTPDKMDGPFADWIRTEASK